MTIEFGKAEDMRWVVNEKEARFEVVVDGKRRTCRVAKKWISDNCGNPVTDMECFDAAKAWFDQITDRMMERVRRGPFEDDESVLLK